MSTNTRFRFAMMAIILILGLVTQSAAAMPVGTGAGSRSAQEAGEEAWQEFTATVGEPFVPNKQPKAESISPDDPRTPNLDLPPLPPDPDKKPVDSAPPERDRDYWLLPMTETFEGAFPNGLWNVFDNNGTTYGEYYWDDDDFKPHNDYWSAWVANGGANGVDPQYNNYANDMDTWMMYGPFDLSGCSAADFEFYYWNKSEANYDFFGWGASPNGSNVYGYQLSGSQESWNYVDFDLAPYLGDTSVWLAFIFRSDSSVTDIGTFVDDIALWCLIETDVKSWTYMVYLDGDNNLESAAVNDFLEMSSVGSSASVNIVALMDRVSGYDTSYDDWTDTRRFYITNGLTPAAANGVSWGEANMGDPETLLKFVRWAKAAYPANHYVLVFWDHGSGWRFRDPNDVLTKAVSFDDTSGGDAIDMPELRNSLSTLTGGGASPFDIVGMDACLMAMIEVDNQIKPYATIRVGSEETEPNDGWPYDTILAALVANPAMSANTLATNTVDFYYSSYGNNNTQSAVNLGSTYTTLNNAVNNFAADLIYYGNNYIAEIQTARNAATQFSYTYYIDLWDFADLVRVYVPEPNINASAIAVKNAVTATVIHEHHGASWPWARGISIYFPKTPGEYDARYDGSSGFLQFTASTDWDDWIHKYHNFANYPAMFNKSGPANGATGQSVTPTLSWGASTGATSYQYCYDTLNDGACNGSYVNVGTNTSVVVSLSEATTYYWQVRATNASGSVYANKGAMWSFTTGSLPAAFNKTAPANGATNQPTSLTLSWAASTGAASYEYCYDTTNDNACSGWTNNGTSTSKALSGLSQSTTYYWHVRALNSFGTRYSNGSATAFWSFTTGGVPGAFNKTSPANGATNQSLSPTLTWGSSANATSYEYCYDTTNDNACSGWTSNGTSTSKSLSGLSQYTTYYWHIRAVNGFGTTYADGLSTAFWSFTTGGLPGAFNKSNPANGATNQPANPTLSWSASSGATGYDYCYDTSNNNACDGSWVSNGSNTSASLGGLGLGTTYYWHVRAYNSFGTTFANANVWWSFTTGNVPGAFNKTTPANGATNQSTSPTLTWSASSGAASYSYCYDTNNNNACDGSWINNGVSTNAPISGLTSPTNYYWHVKAVNSFGETESNGGIWWNFTTANTAPSFTSVPTLAGTVGVLYTYNITTTDPDGDPMTITAPTKPAWLTLTDNGNGTATLSGTPVAGNLGANPVTLAVSDGINSPASQSFTINVTSAPPVPETKTFKSNGAQDGWILESAETSNTGGTLNSAASTLNLGDDSAKKQYRSILSFNTSALPDNAVITKVTLRLRRQGVAGGGNPVALFQGFMVDIKKGSFGTAALTLSDFKTTANKTVGPQSPALTAGWYNLNLTPAKAYINRLATNSGLTQMRLRFKLDDNNNTVANILKLYSGNAAASNRPQLIIEYYVP